MYRLNADEFSSRGALLLGALVVHEGAPKAGFAQERRFLTQSGVGADHVTRADERQVVFGVLPCLSTSRWARYQAV